MHARQIQLFTKCLVLTCIIIISGCSKDQAYENYLLVDKSGRWEKMEQVQGGVYSLEVYKNKLYIAGLINVVNGATATGIAVYDGTTFSHRNIGSGNMVINNMLVIGDTLFIAGAFNENGYQNLCTFDGNNFGGMNYSLNGTCYDVAFYGGYVTAAWFTNNSAYVNRFDNGSWVGMGNAFNGTIFELEVFNNSLYAGGSFSYSPGNIYHLSAWNGTAWGNAGNPNNYISSLAAYNNNLYVAGDFTSINFNPYYYFARFDGTNWYSMGAIDSRIETFYQHGGYLYAGGGYYQIGGNNLRGHARYNGTQWEGELGKNEMRPVWSFAYYNGHLYAGNSYGLYRLKIQS